MSEKQPHGKGKATASADSNTPAPFISTPVDPYGVPGFRAASLYSNTNDSGQSSGARVTVQSLLIPTPVEESAVSQEEPLQSSSKPAVEDKRPGNATGTEAGGDAFFEQFRNTKRPLRYGARACDQCYRNGKVCYMNATDPLCDICEREGRPPCTHNVERWREKHLQIDINVLPKTFKKKCVQCHAQKLGCGPYRPPCPNCVARDIPCVPRPET